MSATNITKYRKVTSLKKRRKKITKKLLQPSIKITCDILCLNTCCVLTYEIRDLKNFKEHTARN